MELAASERFRPQAERILREQSTRLRNAGVPGTLELVGGSSVNGALTKGDVDLHLRVEPAVFKSAVARLRGMFAVGHPEIWCSTLATFDMPADLPTGLAVTPIGAEHDVRFSRVWQMLAADPALVSEYNAVKRDAAAADYERRKSEFFDGVLDRWAEHQSRGSAL
jgi:GrpB-like predicted nucleotidyltransferase (UPF0157 family)